MKAYFTCLFAVALACGVLAQQSRPANIPWPGHGAIAIEVPINWSLHRAQQGDAVCTLRADRAGKPAAVVQVSLVALPPGKTSPTKAELRQQLGKNVTPELPGSVEKVFLPRALTLAEGFGWYVELTDSSLVGKPTEPENLKVMRSGIATLNSQTMAVITMQFDDPESPAPEEMMRMIETLRLLDSPSDSLQISRVDDFYELSVPLYRVILKIPANGIAATRANVGGGTASPRYFYFSGNNTGLVVSGWIENADRYSDLLSFWKGEQNGFKSGGQPEPTRVSYGKIGAWETIEYDVAVPRGYSSHIRAELTKANAWIDLHASMTADRPASEMHAELRAFIESLVAENK